MFLLLMLRLAPRNVVTLKFYLCDLLVSLYTEAELRATRGYAREGHERSCDSPVPQTRQRLNQVVNTGVPDFISRIASA